MFSIDFSQFECSQFNFHCFAQVNASDEVCADKKIYAWTWLTESLFGSYLVDADRPPVETCLLDEQPYNYRLLLWFCGNLVIYWGVVGAKLGPDWGMVRAWLGQARLEQGWGTVGQPCPVPNHALTMPQPNLAPTMPPEFQFCSPTMPQPSFGRLPNCRFCSFEKI